MHTFRNTDSMKSSAIGMIHSVVIGDSVNNKTHMKIEPNTPAHTKITTSVTTAAPTTSAPTAAPVAATNTPTATPTGPPTSTHIVSQTSTIPTVARASTVKSRLPWRTCALRGQWDMKINSSEMLLLAPSLEKASASLACFRELSEVVRAAESAIFLGDSSIKMLFGNLVGVMNSNQKKNPRRRIDAPC